MDLSYPIQRLYYGSILGDWFLDHIIFRSIQDPIFVAEDTSTLNNFIQLFNSIVRPNLRLNVNGSGGFVNTFFILFFQMYNDI